MSSRSELEWKVIIDQVTSNKEEFEARLAKSLVTQPGPMPTPCRIWVKARRGGKYGKTYPTMSFRIPGPAPKAHIMIDVHRIFLMIEIARPIAEGMEAGHTCHNNACVAHVEEVTRSKNLKDRDNRRKGNYE